LQFSTYEIEGIGERLVREEGLPPVPQRCIEGYYVDFAFPDVRLAVEADGAAYHEGDRR
jgi:very-short-patch-repair endonuclease